MNAKQLIQDLRSGKLQNVYYFTGPEDLKKKEALEELRRIILPEGLEILNETVLEDCSAQDIIDNSIQLPVMCDRRLVVIRNWAPFIASKKEEKNTEPEDSPETNKNTTSPADTVRAWLVDAPDSCVIVFWFTKSVKPYIKKANGHVEFAYLTGDDLKDECVHYLEQFGKTINKDALEELTLMVGQDLNRLTTELEKLSDYTQKRKNVTIQDVRAIAVPSAEYTVFNILDRLLENNMVGATLALNDMLKQSGNNPTQIISIITSSMRVYLMLRLATDSNTDVIKLSKAMNISDGRRRFVLDKYKGVPAEVFQKRYDACIRADAAVKSGLAKDKAALDALMFELLLPPTATSRNRNSSQRHHY